MFYSSGIYPENTATWKTPNTWLRAEGPPSETANVSLQQTERSRFQDLIDTQASALSVIHMSVTS